MAHTHVVVDSDAHFIIDPMTRAIKKEESTKTSLIVGDHNSERFSFELPRYIEGHDMSLCNVVRVHYMNTNSSKTEQQSVGVYEVDDFGIMSTDDTKMGLTWLISNNATKYVGKLAFTVQFACMTGHRVDYSWQTGVYSSMSISEGISGTEIVFDEYADILRQWWLKIYATSELPIKIYTTEDFAALNGNTETEVLYLLEDDPTPGLIESHDESIKDHATRITANEESIADYRPRIMSNEQSIDDLDRSVMDHERNIMNHATRITANEESIADHTTRIMSNEQSIDDLDRRVFDHEGFITSNEQSINDHETRITATEEWTRNTDRWIQDQHTATEDHATRIAANEKSIAEHATRIAANEDSIDNLTSNVEGFYSWQSYTPITSTTDIESGLWLFRVLYKTTNGVHVCATSVIMDTSCDCSSAFYIPGYTGWPFVLKAVESADRIGYVRISVRRFIDSDSSNSLVEIDDDVPITVYGRPFGFKN